MHGAPDVGADLRSDGKDYRADYEHDDLSPNNLKPPDAFLGERPAMRNL